MLKSPGTIGRLGAALRKAASAAVTYLLNTGFTRADVTIANAETLGPTGSGATYVTTDSGDIGVGTVGDASTGVVKVASNELEFSGLGVSIGNTGIHYPARTRAAGSVFKGTFQNSSPTSSGYRIIRIQLGSAAAVTTATRVCSAGLTADFSAGESITLNTFDPVGSNELSWSVGTFTEAADVKLALVLGGYDSAGTPDETGDYGTTLFYNKGSAWELGASDNRLNTATLYPRIASVCTHASGALTTADDLRYPDLTIPEVFTPTGYALDTFTDTDGVFLTTGHTLDSGGTWTTILGTSLSIASNRAAIDDHATDTSVGNVKDLSKADVFISAIYLARSPGAPGNTFSSNYRNVIRWVDDSNNWHHRINSVVGTTKLEILEITAGSATSRANAVVTEPGDSTLFRVSSKVVGNVHEAWFGGNNKITYTSASHNTATKHGISLNQSTASTPTTACDSFYYLPITSANPAGPQNMMTPITIRYTIWISICLY